MEKEKGVQELLKYHVNRLPLWTKAKYGGEAVFCCSVTGGLVDPTTDPLRIGTRRNANYGRLLYFDQGLCSWVGRDGDFSTCKGQYAVNDAVLIVPGIFQRWEQPDPVTYIFHVRKGVLWPVVPPMARTDREVTAEDVKWYIDIQQREGVYKDSFVDVKSTEATDRYTLKVNMLAPLPDFLRSIAQSGIGLFPKECYDEKGCLGQKLITPGPWLVKEYTARQKLVYEKNPEFFFKGLPYVDRWVILQITDPASQKTAFITGQVTNYRSYQRDEALSVGARVPGYKIHLQYNAAGPIGFRAKLDGPFADVRVRRALMMALDLRGLWELASSGNGVVPTEFGRDLFGFGKSFYFTLDNATEWYQYNPERAKRLLAEAGYPNGFTTKMATSSASGVLYEFILGVQGEWKKNLNIEMPIQAVDAIAFRNLLTEKKWEGMHFSAGAGAWTDGNTGFLTLLKGSPFNYQDIDDPVINDLYLKARRELDPDKRAALIWQAEQHEMNQIYWFRLDQHFPYDLMQPWEMNGASHAWDFYYSLGVVWLTMLDPDKVKK
ncbi:MAG: ABC transporter substrate-binding protein [SAR202 cluster bacterium]|nr:ABC transporter substrate-binding protein [SAR202 cluster bacterium]